MHISTKYNKLSSYRLILLLFPFFKPVGVEYYTMLDFFFKVSKLLSMMIILFILFTTLRKNKIKIYFGIIGLILFWSVYILNGIVTGNVDSDILNNSIISVFLFEFITYEANRNKLVYVIDALSKIFIVLIWIHFISVIVVNNGLYLFGNITNDYLYLLGTDNYSSFNLLPMIGIVAYYSVYRSMNKKMNKSVWIYTLMYLGLNFYTKSYTAMLSGIIICVLLLIYSYKNNFIRIFNIKGVLILSAIVLGLIVIFNIQNVLSYFLENVISKGITLNSRTIIWKCTIDLIKRKPILGYGSFSREQLSSFILYGTTHAHNIFLELLLRTGIIGTIGYLIFMIWPIKVIWNKSIYKSAFILLIFYIGQIVLFFMDFYPNIQYYYCFMAIIYNLNKFQQIEKR